MLQNLEEERERATRGTKGTRILCFLCFLWLDPLSHLRVLQHPLKRRSGQVRGVFKRAFLNHSSVLTTPSAPFWNGFFFFVAQPPHPFSRRGIRLSNPTTTDFTVTVH